MAKYNRNLVNDRLVNKLTEEFMVEVVTESFVRSLPFNTDEVKKNMAEFKDYARNLSYSLDIPKLVDEAIESTKVFETRDFLSNFKSSAISIATEASKKILDEAGDAEVDDIVKDASINTVDLKKIRNAADEAGVDDIVSIITEKVVGTIHDEKVKFDKAEKLKNEVKEMIKKVNQDDPDGEINSSEDNLDTNDNNDSSNDEEEVQIFGDDSEYDDDDDDALESHLNLLLSPTDPRDHVSVFTKLNDICMESFMFSNEEYDTEIPFKSMEQVTMERTFNIFNLEKRSCESAIESITRLSELNGASTSSMEDLSKISYIASICILTFLETVKTMNLFKPSSAEICNFIGRGIPNAPTQDSLGIIRNQVKTVMNKFNNSASTNATYALEEDCAVTKDYLVDIKGKLDSMDKVFENDINYKSTINYVENCIGKLNNKIESFKGSQTNTGIFNERKIINNISALESALKTLSRKPIVESIECRVDSSRATDKVKEGNFIDIIGKGKNNSPVAKLSICLEQVGTGSLVELIKETAKASKMPAMDVNLYFTDKSYTTKL